MIVYLLKSAMCLVVFLAVYHLLLETKKMHKFNRFYLLVSVAAALILPVLTIKISTEALNHTPLLSRVIVVQQPTLPVPSDVNERVYARQNSLPYSPQTLLIIVYVLVACVFAAEFAVNLIKIRSRIYKNPKVSLNEASLVLLSNQVVPHSFLGYVFLTEDDYTNGRIEDQLLEHELSHVRQLHSLDVLFIELLKIVFWFNPIFIFYKKAIQLNHEFLADEAVLSTYDVAAYQYLLLEQTILTTSVPITSNLNYSLTKKRLTMMIKTTSKLKIWTARLAVLPVLAAMLFLFSMKTVSDVSKPKPAALNNTSGSKEDPSKETFFKNATIWIENKDGKYMPKKYEDMTAAEKASLPAPKLPRNTPTKQELSAWKTEPTVYAICINNKWVENSQLAKYKPEDFVHFGVRKPGSIDKRVNKNYGKASNLVDLLTENQFDKEFVEPYIQPGKWLGVYQGKIWPGGADGSVFIKKYFEVEEIKKTNPNYGKRELMPPFKPEKLEGK